MKTKPFFVLVAVAALLAVATLGDRAVAQSANAANKVHVSASTIDVVGPTGPTTILSTSMKTSTNADLILSVTAECAITIDDPNTTTFQIAGSDSALAHVKIWVEIDAVAVPVAVGDDGKVVFCRRENTDSMFNLGTSNFGTHADRFDAMRNANSFNWVKKNVGNGTHSIAVKAEVLHATSSSTSFSQFGEVNPPVVVEGRVGRRTLVVEPVSPGK